MVGNPSSSSIAIAIMALHATIAVSPSSQNNNVVAAAAAENSRNDEKNNVSMIIDSSAMSGGGSNKNGRRGRRIKRQHQQQHRQRQLRRQQRQQYYQSGRSGDELPSESQPRQPRRRQQQQDATDTSSPLYLELPQQQQQQQQLQDDTNNNQGIRTLASTCGKQGLWHPEVKSGNENGCTNDNHYPAEWVEDASIQALMFHGSSQSCCDFFFGGGCEIYDRCGGSGGGDGGAPPPTPPSNSDCAWHADMGNKNGCSNDDNYPKEWLDTKVLKHMFHPTSEACCKSLYPTSGGKCPSRDGGCTKNVLKEGGTGGGGGGSSGTTTTPSNGNCVTAGWHADLSGGKDGCTNDDNYPGDWLTDPQLLSSMFFPTAQECCSTLVTGHCTINDRSCRIDPKLTSGGCDANVWHPDVQTRVGCSNSKNYPPDWKDVNTEDFLFKSALACCTKYHQDWSCPVRDGCTNQITNMEITKAPTRHPTKRPTPSPTDHPTTSPTPAPSPFPTVKPPEYYIVHGVGVCNNDKIVPKPYYVTMSFPTPEKCCQASFARESCFYNLELEQAVYEPTPEPAPTREPVPTDLPTLSPISGIVVEITMFGSMQIENVAVPSSNSQDWPKLKNVLMSTISSVMAKSPICHPGLTVTLSTYAGQSFPYWLRRRQLLDKGGEYNANYGDEVENEAGNDQEIIEARQLPSPSSLMSQADERRLAVSQTLQFEMTIPTRCDDECQLATGHVGKLAFDELEDHFLRYIETGAFSYTLKTIGAAWYLIDDDDGSYESPSIISGTLSYRMGVKSDVTWVPTFMPTVATATEIPTYFPTGGPTNGPSGSPMAATAAPTTHEPTSSPTTVCSAFKWHYGGGDVGCTNSPEYPALWDLEPTIGSRFLFDTLEDCCYANTPEACPVTETCEVTNYAQTFYCDLTGRKYHPTTPSERTCTNSKDYPSAWNNSDRFLFVSAEECCESYYSDGLCLIKNAC